jgi:hypothetical protein
MLGCETPKTSSTPPGLGRSEKNAACDPYMRSWPMLTPRTSASQMRIDALVLTSQKNGNANSSENSAPPGGAVAVAGPPAGLTERA